ncbi:cytochrome ubiquinol oxidase subunit I, partial [Lactococcus garvieae]|uniref:cytochrome ubiquinol oxidase subunit I n=1 Tax=Lactococcus garvieae TaxID=1363 RepID=UPI00254BB565
MFFYSLLSFYLNSIFATLTSFSALLTNPQTTLEFTHVITGSFLTGGFAVAGISAFQI